MSKKEVSLRQLDAQKGDARLLPYVTLLAIAKQLNMKIPKGWRRQQSFLDKNRKYLTKLQDIPIN